MLHDNIHHADCHFQGPPHCSRELVVEDVLVSTAMPALNAHLVCEISRRQPGLGCRANLHPSVCGPIFQKTIVIMDVGALRAHLSESADILPRFHTILLILDLPRLDLDIPDSMRIVTLFKPDIEQFMQALSGISAGRVVRLQNGNTIDEAIQLKTGKQTSPALTKRESEVFDGMIKGRRYKQIADSLGVSEATVKVHAYRIFDKTGVRGKHRLASIHHGAC